jgi:hypothetical protein
LYKCENNSKNCEIEKLNSETLKLSNQIKEREMIYSDTIDKHEKQLLDKENVTKQYEIKVQELEHNIMEKKTEIENLRKVFSTQEESVEKVHSEKMKLVEELLEKDLTLGKLNCKELFNFSFSNFCPNSSNRISFEFIVLPNSLIFCSEVCSLSSSLPNVRSFSKSSSTNFIFSL